MKQSSSLSSAKHRNTEMASFTQKLSLPFASNERIWYLGYGALGGAIRPYLGSLIQGNTAKLELILTGFGLESALAGAVTNYLFMVFGDPDADSAMKGIALGLGGSWIWEKFIRSFFVSMGLLSA